MANITNIVLTINAGSSSIKFAAYVVASEEELSPMAAGQIQGIGGAATFSAKTVFGRKTSFVIDETHGEVGHKAGLQAILDWLQDVRPDARVLAVGHRVVHGGPDYAEPMLLNAARIEDLRALTPLAPLHQPHNIAGIEAAMHAFPKAAQVACFDTAFHRTHPYVADTFALPRRFYDEGIRRYGFHGLSYEFIVRRLHQVYPALVAGRVVVAHLGNGASACAMIDGRSIASTMGFTALDGLPMGTRCGQLDPGVVLYLSAEKKMSAQAITDLLYNDSGLKGMSGISNDMRELEASDAPAAKDAIDYFVSRIRREIGGLAAAIGGLDGIIFTGGIGENSWRVREAVLDDMAWLGVIYDKGANQQSAQFISTPKSAIQVLVLKTDEERMIAEHTTATAGLMRQLAPIRGSRALAETA